MKKNEIEIALNGIMQRRFQLDFLQDSEKRTQKLLGKIGLPARELLHIYFDVEKTFGITIPEAEIVAGRFDTFDNILSIVQSQLSEVA